MTTIVTRAGKGSPLTHTEVDTNFTNLNTNKLEAGAIALGSAATPSISFTGDTNTGIYSPGADQLAVATNGTGRVFVDATGLVGIGSSAPTGNLSFGATDAIINSDTSYASDNKSVSLAGGGTASTARGGYMQLYGNEYTTTGGVVDINSGNVANSYVRIQGRSSSSDIRFWINASEAGRFDTSGRLLIGTSTSSTGLEGQYAKLQVIGNSSGGGGGSYFTLARDEAATGITADEMIARITFGNTGPAEFAYISCQADGAASAGDYPGRLVFSTTADGGSSPTERMRISANGNVNVVGALSKGSGSFRIDHPLSEKKDTHHLIHSFIEGPQADLIYRGHVNLINGKAIINIDDAARMAEGTFNALCTNVCCFTSNESDWTAVRGSVSDNILTIEAQDLTSTAEVCWMVIGERKDQHMLDTNWTDENGRVITEPLKEVTPSVTP